MVYQDYDFDSLPEGIFEVEKPPSFLDPSKKWYRCTYFISGNCFTLFFEGERDSLHSQ
jgi:hypothetical protein